MSKTFRKGDIVGVGTAKRIPDELQLNGYHLGVVILDNLNNCWQTIVRIFSHSKDGEKIDYSKFSDYQGKLPDTETYLSNDSFTAKTKDLRTKGGKYEID